MTWLADRRSSWTPHARSIVELSDMEAKPWHSQIFDHRKVILTFTYNTLKMGPKLKLEPVKIRQERRWSMDYLYEYLQLFIPLGEVISMEN